MPRGRHLGRCTVRVSSVLSEAWRNINSGASRVLMLGAALFMLLGALAVTEVQAVGALVRQAVEYQESGAAITTFVSAGAIDGPTCVALNDVAGVRAAGAIRSLTIQPLPLSVLPAGPIPAFEATPGFSRMLLSGSDRGSPGVWISDAVAEMLAVKVGSNLLTADGQQLTVAAVYPFPSDGRAAGLQNAIVEPVQAEGAFDECWVQTTPYNPGVVTLARMTLIADPPAGTGMTTGALNPTLGSSFDAAALFGHRATARGWVAGAIAGFAVGAVGILSRRRHLAEARHAGVEVPAQALQTLLETAAVVVAALPPAALACALLAPQIDTVSTWLLGLRILVAGGAATLFGALAAMTMIRRRSLHRYLKD